MNKGSFFESQCIHKHSRKQISAADSKTKQYFTNSLYLQIFFVVL